MLQIQSSDSQKKENSKNHESWSAQRQFTKGHCLRVRILALFFQFFAIGLDGVFDRSDIAAITSDSVTAAGNLITKLKWFPCMPSWWFSFIPYRIGTISSGSKWSDSERTTLFLLLSFSAAISGMIWSNFAEDVFWRIPFFLTSTIMEKTML